MNIETATLVASAVQIGLMIVFGLWIKHFVDQQIKSKDASIQALESIIKFKDSEISRLEKDSVPAMAAAYQQVKEFADAMAQEAISLKEKLAVAESRGKLTLDSGDVLIRGARLEVTSSVTKILSRRLRELSDLNKPLYGGQDVLDVLKRVVQDIEQLTSEIRLNTKT